MGRTTLILASASPARRQMLRAAGVEPEVVVSGLDESTVEEADPRRLCAALARRKAEVVVARVRQRDPVLARNSLVLGCDSVLEFADGILGKPADAAEAARRWRAMRGHTGVLHTGQCLIDGGTGKVAEGVASTRIFFGDISDAEIAAYVDTGEPLRVAGGFTIDGLGGWFIEGIAGDHGAVVGLSLPLLRRLLSEVGTSVPGLWTGVLASQP